jgi:hypothetical protein
MKIISTLNCAQKTHISVDVLLGSCKVSSFSYQELTLNAAINLITFNTSASVSSSIYLAKGFHKHTSKSSIITVNFQNKTISLSPNIP